MSETRIQVGGEHPYEVIVGTGALGALPGLVGKRAETVAVIHDERLGPIARPACRALEEAGYQVAVTEVPSGESAKDVAVLARLWSWLAQSRVTRSDCVVGIGGGATTDLAGFAAAIYHRGVAVVHVATTLLAQVDAAHPGLRRERHELETMHRLQFHHRAGAQVELLLGQHHDAAAFRRLVG